MGLPDLNDEQLVEGLRDGKEEAWVLLYRRHQGRIYRFALHMGGSEALAQDAVQETFLAFLKRADRWDAARGALSNFLLGIARNKMLRLLKQENQHSELEPGAVFEHPGATPAEELLRRQSHDRVQRAVLGLPTAYREALVLCDLQELDYAEAARILECPVGTVSSRLHRARQILSERLRDLVALGAEAKR